MTTLENHPDKKVKKVDHLNEDEPLTGQKYVCISFLSPEGIKNCSVRGLKIRGVYADKADADKRAEELQKLDPDFDVFVGEVGKWLPWDPDPNSVNDQVYQEKELNDLMKGYKDNLDKAKKMQSQRKADMIKDAAQEEQNRNGGAVKERLQKKLEEKKKEKRMTELVNKQLKNNSDNNELDKQKEDIQHTVKSINEKKQTIASLDEKLNKIQQLYEKLNKKNSETDINSTHN